MVKGIKDEGMARIHHRLYGYKSLGYQYDPMGSEPQVMMPSQNRIINWLQRDYQGPYSTSGYRKNLGSLIIDRETE